MKCYISFSVFCLRYGLGRVVLKKRVHFKEIYNAALNHFKPAREEAPGHAYTILSRMTSSRGQNYIEKMLQGELDSLVCKYLIVVRLDGSCKAKRPNRLALAKKREMSRVIKHYLETGHTGAFEDCDLPYADHETPITRLQRYNSS